MSSSVPYSLPAFQAIAQSALRSGAYIWLGTVIGPYDSSPGDVTGVTSGITLQIAGVRFNADEFAELGPTYRHEEHYVINCTLWSWAGGTPDYAALIQDAGACYADLSIAVANAPQLEIGQNGIGTFGNFRLAWTRQLNWTPTPDPFGRAAVQIDFEVQCQARVNSLSDTIQ